MLRGVQGKEGTWVRGPRTVGWLLHLACGSGRQAVGSGARRRCFGAEISAQDGKEPQRQRRRMGEGAATQKKKKKKKKGR